MRALKKTPSGDLDLTSGRLSLVEGAEAVKQKVEARMRFFLGEWFLDKRLGLPYFGTILVKAPDLLLIRSVYFEAVQGTDGVSTCDSCELSHDKKTRKLFVSWSATLATGEVIGASNGSTPFIVAQGS